MIDLGIHTPFDWVEEVKEINDSVKYELPAIAMKLTAQVTECKLINLDTGAETDMSIQARSHDIQGQTINSSGISGLVPTSGRYYLKVVAASGGFSSTLYSDGVITYNNCTMEIQSSNSCSDEYYDWDSELLPSVIKLTKFAWLEDGFEREKETIITNKGREERVKRTFMVKRFEFVGPTSYVKLLNGIAHNDSNAVKDFSNNSIPIRNFEVEDPKKILDGKYATFTCSFEYDNQIKGNTCCDILNIDDILSPEYTGGEGCGSFAVSIGESGGVLTPTPTDAPTGTLTYRWYKDGVYKASSTTLNVDGPGIYKVAAKVGTCEVYSTYNVPDECAIFSIEVDVTNNQITAAVSNIPVGETVSYSVKKDGVEVATSLPYTATTTGVYFVHATAGSCSKVEGVYVVIVTPVNPFTVSITRNGNTLTAVHDATSPTFLWELETYNSETGISSKTTIGTASTAELTASGIYHLSVTEGGDTKTAYYLYQTGFNVTVTNLDEIANASGTVQVINGPGNVFDFNYDESRYHVFRNETKMTYRPGVAASLLDVFDYSMLNGDIIFSSVIPLTADDRVEIRPV